jgi:hypothetical protein
MFVAGSGAGTSRHAVASMPHSGCRSILRMTAVVWSAGPITSASCLYQGCRLATALAPDRNAVRNTMVRAQKLATRSTGTWPHPPI